MCDLRCGIDGTKSNCTQVFGGAYRTRRDSTVSKKDLPHVGLVLAHGSCLSQSDYEGSMDLQYRCETSVQVFLLKSGK